MKRRWTAAFCCALSVVFALVGPGSAAAEAAAVQALVSSDGINYASTLGAPLFAGAGSLVPGHSISATLWARNPTAVPVALRVSVSRVDLSSAAIGDGVSIFVDDSAAGSLSAVANLKALNRCEILNSTPAVGPGESVKMIITLQMSRLASPLTRSANLAIDLVVAMRDAEAGPFARSACQDGGVTISSAPSSESSAPSSSSSARGSTLVEPGSDLPLSIVVGGGLLVGVGLFLVARRRRVEADLRREDHG